MPGGGGGGTIYHMYVYARARVCESDCMIVCT